MYDFIRVRNAIKYYLIHLDMFPHNSNTKWLGKNIAEIISAISNYNNDEDNTDIDTDINKNLDVYYTILTEVHHNRSGADYTQSVLRARYIESNLELLPYKEEHLAKLEKILKPQINDTYDTDVCQPILESKREIDYDLKLLDENIISLLALNQAMTLTQIVKGVGYSDVDRNRNYIKNRLISIMNDTNHHISCISDSPTRKYYFDNTCFSVDDIDEIKQKVKQIDNKPDNDMPKLSTRSYIIMLFENSCSAGIIVEYNTTEIVEKIEELYNESISSKHIRDRCNELEKEGFLESHKRYREPTIWRWLGNRK